MIEFDFTSFSLELHSSCGWDKLIVYDGATVDAPSLGTYCGSDLPRPILTNGNTAALLFETDSSTVSTGFSVDYAARDHGIGETTPGVLPPTNGPSESKRISLGPVCMDGCHSSRMRYFAEYYKGWRCVSPREFRASENLVPHAKIGRIVIK